MAKPQGERVASLETAMINLDKKVDAGFKDIKLDIKALGVKFDASHASNDIHFATKEELNTIRTQLVKLKSRSWVQNTLSAILGAVITSLIGVVVYFLTRG